AGRGERCSQRRQKERSTVGLLGKGVVSNHPVTRVARPSCPVHPEQAATSGNPTTDGATRQARAKKSTSRPLTPTPAGERGRGEGPDPGPPGAMPCGAAAAGLQSQGSSAYLPHFRGRSVGPRAERHFLDRQAQGRRQRGRPAALAALLRAPGRTGAAEAGDPAAARGRRGGRGAHRAPQLLRRGPGRPPPPPRGPPPP